MPPATTYSCFVFTCNNPTPEQEKWLQETVSKSCTFLIYGHENAPTTGTPHLQGFFVLSAPARKAVQIKKFSKRQMWIGVPTDPQKTPSYWLQYCTKEDAQPFQFGICPPDEFYLSQISKQGQGHRSDIMLAHDIYKAGGTVVDVAQQLPEVYVRHTQGIKSLYYLLLPKPVPLEKLDNEWIYGPPRVGKSRSVRFHNPDLYLKNKSKWWDGYMNQHAVLIDEFSPYYSYMADDLKNWADHYEFTCEVKGAMITIRPKRIIVTSNYSIRECFPHYKDYQPLEARFKVIHMTEPFQIPESEEIPSQEN